MALTREEFTGNDVLGANNAAISDRLNYNFLALQNEDIKVKLNGVLITPDKYTFHTDPTNAITFNSINTATTLQLTTGAPKDGVSILIYRDTDISSAKNNFSVGSSIRADDLNDNQKQAIFAVKEVKDLVDDDLVRSTDTWSSNDTEIASTAAINNRIAGLEWDKTTLDSRIDTRADARIAADATIPTISQVEGLTYNTTTLNSRIDTRADQRIASSAIAITTVQTAANESAQLALTTQEGDVVVRTDQNRSYVRNSGTAGTMADFTELLAPTGAVTSVNSNTGAITADQIAAAVEAASDSNTFTDADHTKLNNIEASATADQTDAEIKTAYENNSDTNAFTDADHTKLDGIESGATADQTDSEIKTAYENNSDTNAFTDAEKTKLSGIETGATADQSDTEIKTAYENNNDTNAFTDALLSKLNGIESGATADQTDEEIQDVVGAMLTGNTETGITVTYEDTDGTIDFVVASQTDENFTTADHNKLDGIESGATADQTAAEIRTLVDSASDSNVFTDADHTKLDGIATGAEVNVQADFNETDNTSDAFIKNKPTIPTNNNQLTNGAGFTTNTGTVTGVSGTAPITSSGGTTPAIGISAATTSTAGSMSAADKTKLDAIESGATADQTDAEVRAAVEAASDSNVFTDADHTKLNGIEASATADQTGAEIKSLYEGESDTNAFTDSGKTKLSGIETNATADQTASEIRTLVESASDSNVFTDADHTKLNGIETSADVTDAANVKAAMESFTSSVIIPDNIGIRFGADSNLRIYHDANDDWSYIVETDDEAEGLRIRGQNLILEDNAGDNYVLCRHDAEVALYYDNASKLQTTTYGVEIRGDGNSQDGAIQFNCSQNSHGVKIQAPPHSASASYTLVLPNTDGNANQVLKTDGSGNLDWVDQSGGSGGVAATGGTFTGSVTFEDAINENVFAITDAASVAIDPDNGMIQTWTLGANRTATDSLTTGQSVLLMITAGSYTLTWPTITWAGGSAPTLSTSSTTAIELWKVGSTLYGANVGDV